MATQFEIDCALMDGAAYRSTRDPINRFPLPTESGWNEIPDSYSSLPSGFEAVSFQRGTGANAEIVISFAGTYLKLDDLRDFEETGTVYRSCMSSTTFPYTTQSFFALVSALRMGNLALTLPASVSFLRPPLQHYRALPFR